MAKLQTDERLRRLYMAYANDGLLDLFAGWIIFLAGLMLFTELFWMAGIYVAAFLPLAWTAKEKVTLPRLRREELSPAVARQTATIKVILVAGLALSSFLGLVVLFLFQRSAITPAARETVLFISAGVVAAAILGGFVFVGRACRAPRWYAYAALAAVFAALAWALQAGLPWVIMAVGAVMALTGAVCLVRFLRSHPVLPEEERPAW